MERLVTLDLLPLCYRREFLDLVFVFNSMYDINAFNILDSVYINDTVILRNGDINNMVSTLPVPKTESLFNYYLYRIVNLWNKLPTDIRLIELNDNGSNKHFKDDLKRFYTEKLLNTFVTENTCTWLSVCRCSICGL